MSIYNERYDDALSKTSWVSKTLGSGRTYLFKYAPHPERSGYLFVATDLETVHFEALTATSIPTRIGQVALRDGDYSAAEKVNELGFDEQQRQGETILASLSSVFDAGWAGAKVEAESDDYFDAVFAVSAGSFSWLFNMTELRGRQPLTFVAKHLLTPFVTLMGQDRGVEIPSHGTRPVDAVGAVVSDQGVARALRRVVGAPPAASTRATPAPRLSRPSTPPPKPAAPKSPTPPRKTTPRPRVEDYTPRPPTPPRASASQTLKSLIPPSSPTPMARKRSYNYLTVPESELPNSSAPESPSSPGPGAFTDSYSHAVPTLLIPDTEPAMPSSAQPPSSDAGFGYDRSSPGLAAYPSGLGADFVSSSAAPAPTSTQDPLVNTLPKHKKKKKDKKAEEAEEEAEAERRREEMRRKMAKGAGGRLGRRR